MKNKFFSPLGLLLSSVIPSTVYGVFILFTDISSLFYIAFFAADIIFAAIYFTMLRKIQNAGIKQFSIAASADIIITAAVILCKSERVFTVSNEIAFLVYEMCIAAAVIYKIFGAADAFTRKRNFSIVPFVIGTLITPFALFLAVIIPNAMNVESIAIILMVASYIFVIFMLACIIFVMIKNGKENPNASEISPQDYPLPNETFREQLSPNAFFGADSAKRSRPFYIKAFIFGIFLPWVGLILNGSLVSEGGIFGNFTQPFFFIVSVLNGIFLMIPNTKNRYVNLLIFFFKSAGFTYVLYFCAAFIPVIPLGVLGLVILLGLLVFAPYMLFFWQGSIMLKDFANLKKTFDKSVIAFVFIAGMLIIPAWLFAGVSLPDKINFQNAMAYISDNPDASYADVNISALSRTLDLTASGVDNFGSGPLFTASILNGNKNTPIFSNLYLNYVTQGGTLTQENVDLLRNIFFGEVINETAAGRDTQGNSGFSVKSEIETETVFDETANAYRTWVNMSLTNEDVSFAEYKTVFGLPEGVFVSDYYLYVGVEKKPGILADKRAALFVYNRIVSRSLDPGLLRYIGENTLELRVFPFAANEVRKTGFELLHKESFTLKIDGKDIAVNAGGGNADGAFTFTDVSVPGAVLVGGQAIENAPPLKRTPKYFFVIDASLGADFTKNVSLADSYAKQNGITNAQVYFTSYKPGIITDLAGLNDVAKNAAPGGGFNLGLAARMIFDGKYENEFPVIIVVTGDYNRAVKPQYNKADLFPESPYYYVINGGSDGIDGINGSGVIDGIGGNNGNGGLTRYKFSDTTVSDSVNEITLYDAADYKGNAVAKDGESHIILTGGEVFAGLDGANGAGGEGGMGGANGADVVNGTGGASGTDGVNGKYAAKNQFEYALMVRAESKRNKLSNKPNDAGNIKNSFDAHILSDKTAFIVVETEEQEREIFEVQKKLLEGTQTSAAPGTDKNMTEPPLLIVCGIAAALVLVVKFKRKYTIN
jgi:hypothetical protein